jgi:hypothetical protein
MKKYLITSLLLITLIPSIAFASWWNPLSWFNNWKFNKTEKIQEKLPEEQKIQEEKNEEVKIKEELVGKIETEEIIIKKPFTENDISNANKITCFYSQTLSSGYKDSEIFFSVNKPEKTPMVLTFSDFKSTLNEDEILSIINTSRDSNISDEVILDYLNNKGFVINENGNIIDTNLNPKLSYLDATKQITTSSITKILDDQNRFIFMDGSGNNYITIHTIYKKNGISTYSKSVDLMGTPYGTLSTGTCIGS